MTKMYTGRKIRNASKEIAKKEITIEDSDVNALAKRELVSSINDYLQSDDAIKVIGVYGQNSAKVVEEVLEELEPQDTMVLPKVYYKCGIQSCFSRAMHGYFGKNMPLKYAAFLDGAPSFSVRDVIGACNQNIIFIVEVVGPDYIYTLFNSLREFTRNNLISIFIFSGTYQNEDEYIVECSKDPNSHLSLEWYREHYTIQSMKVIETQ